MGLQTLLTIGALLLFTLAVLSYNTVFLENASASTSHKIMLTAISLADDKLEEIKVRNFDENTIQHLTTSTANLSLILGREAGEVFPFADDIDDFNGDTATISAPHAEDYFIKVKINYLDPNNYDNIVTYRTFYKRALVSVTSPYMVNQQGEQDTISLFHIFTLH